MPVRRPYPLALSLLVAAGACHTYRAIPVAPGDALTLADRSRVVRVGGERIELARGAVTRDSVVGVPHAAAADTGGRRVAIPRDSVALIERRRLSWPRTLGLGYVSLALAYALIGTATGAEY